MTTSILLALCCLGFSAVNDFIFKLFSRKNEGSAKAQESNCGMFVSVVGVNLLIFLSIFQSFGDAPINWPATLLWGSIAGFLSLSSNILLIEAMKYLSAGASCTIFRLNMVLVVLVAWLFLGEPMSVLLFCGILCAFLAIIAFLPKKEAGAKDNALARKGFMMSVVACVLRSGMSIAYKYGLSHGTDVSMLPIINAIFWLFGGYIYMLLLERKFALPNKHEILTGSVGGFFCAGVIFFMARMNACGNASVVNPIAQMSFLLTFLLSAIFLKEKITLKKIVALVLGCAAVLFLAAHSWLA